MRSGIVLSLALNEVELLFASLYQEVFAVEPGELYGLVRVVKQLLVES